MALACQPTWRDLPRQVYGYETVTLTTADANGAGRGEKPLCRPRSPIACRRLASVSFRDSAPLLTGDERAGGGGPVPAPAHGPNNLLIMGGHRARRLRR